MKLCVSGDTRFPRKPDSPAVKILSEMVGFL